MACRAINLRMASPARLAVFFHSGDYDRVHQGLSIAVAAAAAGRPVDLFFFWWALDRLVRDELDAPDFGPEHEEVADRFESRNLPTLRDLLGHLKALGGATLIACSGSVEALGVDRARLSAVVDQVMGWSGILQRTAGVVDRFYL
jgi:peroxiredoxin family protein